MKLDKHIDNLKSLLNSKNCFIYCIKNWFIYSFTVQIIYACVTDTISAWQMFLFET